MHKNVKYNARILSLNQEILLIRPKLSLANDGNYREMRYFSPWKGERIVEDFYLPRIVQKLTGQKKCRIGDALISTLDSCMSNETCEELFTPISPALGAGLDGSEITLNSSGSHHELRKLNTRIDLIRQETLKSGGIYLWANSRSILFPCLYSSWDFIPPLNTSCVSIFKKGIKDSRSIWIFLQ